MGIVRISEHWDGRDYNAGAPDDTSATRTWLAITDNRYDSGSVVINYGIANGYFPERFTPHPDNAYLTARRLNAKQKAESPLAWDITCQYATNPIEQTEKDKDDQPNPLLRAAKVRWGSVRYQKPVIADHEAHAVVNSAGDYFDPPPEIDTSRWTATIQKNVLTVPAWLLEYADAINDAAFTIGGLSIERQSAKMMQVEISEIQEENGYEFVVLTLTLELKKRTGIRVNPWAIDVLDQGYRKKVGDDQKDILVGDGETPETMRRPTSPVLLNGAGGVLVNPTPERAVFMSFNVYAEKDFSALPIF